MAALTTLEKARRQIFGNDPAIEADDILNQLITSSSAWVEREVGGDLMLELKTDTLDGNGGSRMLLTRSHSWRPGSPTTVVSSVKVDGVTIPARASVSSTDTKVCRTARRRKSRNAPSNKPVPSARKRSTK